MKHSRLKSASWRHLAMLATFKRLTRPTPAISEEPYGLDRFPPQHDASGTKLAAYVAIASVWTVVCALAALLWMLSPDAPWAVRAFSSLFGPTAAAGGVFAYNSFRERRSR